MRAARAKAKRAQTRERRAARERRLRETVTRLTGCLDLLPGLEARFLALRAGLGAEPPHSRAGAAERVGLPAKRAARTERRGIKHLRRAGRSGGCGPGSARTTVAITGDTGPELQPAVLLAPAPELRRTAEMAGEAQGVKGVEASSGEASGSLGLTRLTSAPVAGMVDESSMTGWYVLLALLVALGVALLVLQGRRRTHFEPVVASLESENVTHAAAPPTASPEAVALVAAAPVAQPVEPAPAGPAAPLADEPPASAPTAEPAAEPLEPSRRRSVAVVAGSLASLAATALIRRRRR